MDVAKVIRKVVPQKSIEAGSNKSSPSSRLQATRNHVTRLQVGGERSATSTKSSSSPSQSTRVGGVKPKLCPKPQALVERVRQERLAQKLKKERVKSDNDGQVKYSLSAKVNNDGVDSNSTTPEMESKGVNSLESSGIPPALSPFTSDSSTEEKKSEKENDSQQPSHSDTVASEADPPSLTSTDNVVGSKVNTECKGQSRLPENVCSTSNNNDSTTKDTKRPFEQKKIDNRKKQSFSSNSTRTSTANDSDSPRPTRLKMRVVAKHKSVLSCPAESTNVKSRFVLNKQSSDITFDRGLPHRHRVHHGRLTSSVECSVVEEGDAERGGEEEGEGGEERFATRVVRFAREKLHKAISIGSPHSLQSQVSPGVCVYVCVWCVCVYITCVYVRVYECVCMCVCVCVRERECVYMCV